MQRVDGISIGEEKPSSTKFLRKWTGSFTHKRNFRNKGALLIFLWHFTTSLVLVHSVSGFLKIQIGLLASMPLYPLAGWLADVYLSRYTLIKYSMWIMWCSAIAENVWSLVKKHNHSRIIYFVIETLCKGASFVGLAGFQSNAIQLSVDQLVDASSSEISSYIRFYSWIYFLSKCTVVLTQTCSCSWFDESFTFFIFPLSLTVSVVTDILLNKWLVKEPVTQNPLKLIYRVLHYAVKNKYPRLRSAFTYWEDKPYNRIDLAKPKYGGPFSTEQVENVKSFIRISLLTAAASIVVGMLFSLYYANGKLQFYFWDSRFIFNCTTSPNSATYMNNCILRAVVENFSMFMLLFFVPLLEWVLFSLGSKCNVCIGHCILHRYLLGMFVTLVYCLSILALEIATMEYTLKNNTLCLLEATATNQFYHDGVQLDYKWLMLPQIFLGLSYYLLYTSGMEFVYAQTPYGMKGLIIGVVFFTCSVFIALFYSYIALIKQISHVSSFIKENCGFCYYGSLATFSIFCLVVGLIIKKKYTLRKRDDDTHNEQIFAVEYFDKYIDK